MYIVTLLSNPGSYSVPGQTSNIERLMWIVICWKPLTIFAKISIFDVGQGSEYAYV